MVVGFMGLATMVVVVVDLAIVIGFVGLAMAVVVVVDFGCGGFGWVISDVFWFWLIWFWLQWVAGVVGF